MRPNFFDFEKYGSTRECSVCREMVETLWTVATELRRWRTRVRERRQLAALDRDVLRDLGVSPAEAERECDKPFRRA